MGALRDYRDQNRAYYGDADELSVAKDLYQRTGWAQSGRSFDDFAAAQGYGEDLAASRAPAAPGGLPAGPAVAQGPAAQGYGLPEADGGVRTSDFVRSLGVGLDQTGQLLGRGMQWAGLTDTGKAVEDLYAQRAAQTQAEQSPAYRAEMAKPWLGDEAQAPGVLSPTKIAGSVIESAPSTAMGMGVGVGAVKTLAGAGMRAGLAGVAGGALGEGGMAGAQAAMETEDMMRAAPEEVLRATPEYRAALAATPQELPEADRHVLARRDVEVDAMLDAAMTTAGLTAVFGAPSGHFLGRTIGGETGKTLGGTVLRQAGLEALQEAPQSASERLVQNVAERQFSNPEKDIWEGVADEAVGGAVTGAAMGGGLGGLAHNPGALRARREFEAAARGTIQEGGLAALSDADLGAAYRHADTLFQQEPEEGMRGVLFEINAEQNRRQRMAVEPEPSATPEALPQPGALSADSQNAPQALPTGEIPLVPEAGPTNLETPETPQETPLALAGVTEAVDAAGDPVTVLDLDRAGQALAPQAPAGPETGPDLSARVAELSALGKTDLNALAGELGIEKPGRIKRAELAAQVAQLEAQTAQTAAPETAQETPPQSGAQSADSQNSPVAVPEQAVPGREEPVTRPQAAQAQEPIAGPLSGPEAGVAAEPPAPTPAQPQAPAMPETGPDLSARTAELSAMPKADLNALAAQLGIWKPGKIKRGDLAAQVAQWEAQTAQAAAPEAAQETPPQPGAQSADSQNAPGAETMGQAAQRVGVGTPGTKELRQEAKALGVDVSKPMKNSVLRQKIVEARTLMGREPQSESEARAQAEQWGRVRKAAIRGETNDPIVAEVMGRVHPGKVTPEQRKALASKYGPGIFSRTTRDANGANVNNGQGLDQLEMEAAIANILPQTYGSDNLFTYLTERGRGTTAAAQAAEAEIDTAVERMAEEWKERQKAPTAEVWSAGEIRTLPVIEYDGETLLNVARKGNPPVYAVLSPPDESGIRSITPREGRTPSEAVHAKYYQNENKHPMSLLNRERTIYSLTDEQQNRLGQGLGINPRGSRVGILEKIFDTKENELRAAYDQMFPSKAATPTSPAPYQGPDRRKDDAFRKRIDELTPEERAYALAHSQMVPELGSARAFQENVPQDGTVTHAYFDLDNFKAVNDKYGHAAGDAVLKAIGQIIDGSTGEGYHLHGDEFVVAGEDAKEVAPYVQEFMASVKIKVPVEGGYAILDGIGVSYGIGQTAAEADAALKRNKRDRAARGLRRPREADGRGSGRDRGEVRPDNRPARSNSPAPAPSQAVAPAPAGAPEGPAPSQDKTAVANAAESPQAEKLGLTLGEKIGGSRKDTAESGGSRVRIPGKDGEGKPWWQKRFSAVQVKETDFRSGGRDSATFWGIADAKGKLRPTAYRFDTKEEAEAAIPLAAVSLKHRVAMKSDDTWEIHRTITDRKFVTIKDGFPSQADAARYLAEHAVEILDIKTGYGEEILAKPEKVLRGGVPRREGPAKGQDFLDAFGFRGVEFGEWNDQLERQEVLNHAYDGLLDMAEILNVPPRALSLNGELALAFGARGRGLSSAKAHYERDYGVINLTKMTGAGSLAHEWFHAADHYFARQDGKASSDRVRNERGDSVFDAKTPLYDYQSHGASTRSKMREELRAAYKTLMSAMATKAEQYTEDTEKADRFVSRARLGLEKALQGIRTGLTQELQWGKKKAPATADQLAKFDALADQLVSGDNLAMELRNNEATGKMRSRFGSYRDSNDVLDGLAGIYKEVRGRSGFNADRSGPFNTIAAHVRDYAKRAKMLADARGEAVKTKHVPTEFAREAYLMDRGRVSNYWSEPHELAARAFSSFLEDKTKGEGRRSDFLVYGASNDMPGYRLLNVRPFPAGEERAAINKAFEAFFQTVKTRETDRGVAMFKRTTDDLGFFSQMAEVLEKPGMLPKTAKTGRDMAQAVARHQRSGKFKGEELTDSGLLDWLESQDGPVTRQEVLEEIAARRVDVREVTHEGDEADIDSLGVDDLFAEQELDEITEDAWYENKQYYVDAVIDDMNQKKEEARYNDEDPTEYDLTEEEIDHAARDLFDEQFDVASWVSDDLEARRKARKSVAPPVKYDEYQLPGGENYKELIFTLPEGGYRSGHWDEPNPMAHARISERTDADGRRVLHVEEVQSDLHQEGRKKGYQNQERATLLSDTIQTGKGAVDARFGEGAYEKMQDELVLLKHATPDAPFKKSWPMLVMKRLIRYAAEHGFDRVAWTRGAEQAARYDLSKDISRVELEKTSGGVGAPEAGEFRSGMLYAYDHDGKLVVDKYVGSPEDVADLIGKEAAEKILAQPERRAKARSDGGALVRELSGVDLSVGGEGMKGFYDVILPAEVGKYVAKWGAKVGEAVIPDADGVTGYGFDVTPAMRESVMGGQPLYRREASPQSKAAADALTAEVARLAAESPGLAGLAGLVDVHAAEATLPAALRREVDAAGLSGRFQGAYYDGRIFVVAANIPDARAGRLALAEGILRHEGRHAGLTRVFGSDLAKQDFFMDAADAIDADVRTWLASNGMAVTPETRAEAAEEIVVEWAVDGVSHGLVDRLLARIMAFLRRVFPGLRPTRPEVRDMLRRAVAAADAWMGGVPDKPGFLGPVGEMSPAFSRYQRDDAQSRQTDTQAFRAWFGDSKVVDDDGNPLVVFHGTRADFSTFKNPDGFRGFYFTRDPAYAEMKTSLANGRIMPVYLSIKNPLVLDGPRSDPGTKSSLALRDNDIERLKRDGYDGIINTTYNEIVAFEPTQIKSATGNIGTFDAANPDIRFKRTPLTGEPESSETVRERLSAWTDATIKSLATAKASEAGFFGRVLRSPEWWKHPVLKRIYGVFRDRTDRAHELMHQAFDLPDGGSLFEMSRDVLTDAKSRALLNEGVDHADVNEVPRERMEQWFRERGASDELVAFWGHLRDKYDALLDERLAPYREMVDKARDQYERQMVRRFTAAGIPKAAAGTFDSRLFNRDGKVSDALLPYLAQVKKQVKLAAAKGITIKGQLADVRLVAEDGTVTLLSLAEAIGRMGQLRGFYAPRLREHGDFVVRGKRLREDGTEEFFRAHKQWRPAAERLRARMEKAGWDMAAVRKQEALPEATQQAVKALELAKTVESAANASEAADAMKKAFTAELVETLADEIKGRGFRAASIRRAGRDGEVVKGYIEDAFERFGRYTSNTAYGLAKMDAAGKAVRAVFGDGEAPGIDIRKEPGTYRLAVEYLGEQLRNPENGDRMVALAKSVASFKFLGFNVKSALVNLTSMMTTVPAALRAYATGGQAGLARIGREIVRSTADYVGHMLGRPGRFSADEQAFMDVIKKESLDDPQFVREASRTFRDTTGRAWSWAMGKAMWMFAKTEQLNRGATLLAGYRLAREAGADHAAAMEAARETSDKAHGVYDKASQPSWTWGTGAGARVGQSFYVYKKYAHNYMQLVHDLFSRGDRKAAIFAVLSPMVLAGGAASVGWPVAKMMAAAVLLALGDDDKDPEKWMYDALRDGLGDDAERFGRFGLFGLAGLDLSGSMGGMTDMPKNAWELFGPAGGVAQDVLVDAPSRLAAGQAGRAMEALLPTAVARPMQAARELDGVTTSKGYPVWDEDGRPLTPTAGETAAKAVGLRPAREATLKARTWEAAREEAALGERRTKLYERYRAWLSKGGDREELAEIVDGVSRYNADVTDAGLSDRVSFITRQSLAGQNRRMATPTARERARLSGTAGDGPEPVGMEEVEGLRHPYYDVARAYARAKKAYDDRREAGDRPGAARLRQQLRLAQVGDLVGDVTGVRAEMTRVKRSGLPEAAKARRLEVLQGRERAAMERAAARGGDLPGRLEALDL